MAIFKTDPMKSLQRDIDAARANRDRLAAKLSQSETSVTARRSEAQQLAFDDADAAVLGRAQAALQAALGDVGTFGGALTKATALLATLEAEHAELIDKRVRASTAAEVAQMAIDIETAAKEFDAAIGALAASTGRAAKFCPDAVGLDAFATSSRMQVPPAVELTVAVMRHYAAAVLRGDQPAALPQSTPAAAKPVQVASPATRRVFSVRDILWSDAGNVRVLAGGFEVDLPPVCAERGLRTGAVALIGSAAFRTLAGTRPIRHPDPAKCENLDGGVTEPKAEAPQPPHEVIKHSGFVETIGQPRLMRVGGTS
jgi:hypothetical protein